MKSIRLLAIVFCVVVSLTQQPIQDTRLFAQAEEVDFTLLGSGSFTLETASLEKGSRISLETDLQEVAAIIVEDPGAERELVRLGTVGIQPELRVRTKSRPEADVVIDSESLKGRFDHRINYNLTKSRSLRVTLILDNGLEFPFVVHSRDSIANRRITQTFSNKDCRPVTLNCSGCPSLTTTCCTVDICMDCVECKLYCGRCSFGGGGGCSLAPAPPQEGIAVSLDDLSSVPLPKSSFVLRRMEPGDGVSFLMEEWAVIEIGGARPGVQVLNASSPEFAAVQSRDLVQSARSARKGRGGPRQTFLVVEAPVHPHNSRFVAVPKLRLSDPEVPPGIPPVQVLVRADFSEKDGGLQGLRILHAQGKVPAKLADLLRSRLELDHRSMEHHRTIVFARVRIDDSIDLETVATALPKCCCGGQWCV